MIEHNPATSALLVGLSVIAEKLDAVAAALERREEPSPGIFRLSSVARQTSQRFRVVDFVYAVNAAGTYGLQIGTSPIFQFVTSGPETKVIPLPILIDSGKDVSISGTPADIVDSFVTFYPE